MTALAVARFNLRPLIRLVQAQCRERLHKPRRRPRQAPQHPLSAHHLSCPRHISRSPFRTPPTQLEPAVSAPAVFRHPPQAQPTEPTISTVLEEMPAPGHPASVSESPAPTSSAPGPSQQLPQAQPAVSLVEQLFRPGRTGRSLSPDEKRRYRKEGEARRMKK